MPEESVMDLRMTLAKTLARANRPSLTNPGAILAEYESWLWAADALLPVIDEHVTTELDQVVPKVECPAGGCAASFVGDRRAHELIAHYQLHTVSIPVSTP